jgi:elongation factor 2 kinase
VPVAAAASAKAPIAATSLRITNAGETATVYSLANFEPRKWEARTVRGLIEDRVMAEGSLRVVYKAWVLDKFYVIKRFKPHVLAALAISTEEALVKLLQEEVVMQRHAWELAARWNALAMPKNVQVNPLFVVKLADRLPQVWAVMEPMLEGADQSYVKYNDNCGGVFAQEGRVRETPQTFSHFTHLVTGGQWLVCDLQGVGDTFTDPQVHTNPRERCPVAGNHGPKGMDDFFATHQCSALCEMVKQRLLLRASSGDAVVSAPPRP